MRGFRAASEHLTGLSCLRDSQRSLEGSEPGLGTRGSVGFELATGVPVVKPESDLDIVIYADRPIPAAIASALCGCANGLAGR